MVRICSFEASISAGKTTLIENIMKKVKGNKKYILVPEPVEEWRSIYLKDGRDFLAAYYDNINENALSFQLVALFTRRQLMLKKIKEAEEIEKVIGEECILITERTVLSDYHTFAKMLISQGHIHEHGAIAYKMWFDVFSKEFNISKALYIKVSPETCFDRIHIRNREGEDGISLKYLKDLHHVHETFYDEVLSKLDCKVISNDHDLNSVEYDMMICDVINFFNL